MNEQEIRSLKKDLAVLEPKFYEFQRKKTTLKYWRDCAILIILVAIGQITISSGTQDYLGHQENLMNNKLGSVANKLYSLAEDSNRPASDKKILAEASEEINKYDYSKTMLSIETLVFISFGILASLVVIIYSVISISKINKQLIPNNDSIIRIKQKLIELE